MGELLTPQKANKLTALYIKSISCPLLGGYDEPDTLSYQITLFGPISADVKHLNLCAQQLPQLSESSGIGWLEIAA